MMVVIDPDDWPDEGNAIKVIAHKES